MTNKTENMGIDLICVIVNFGMGSKILKFAKKQGISGGTIALGKGTAGNKFWEYIGLSDIRKEIIFLAAYKDTSVHALEEINKEFEISKPNHGIMFTTSISNLVGTRSIKHGDNNYEGGEDNIMYNLITAIVLKGKAEDVVTAAEKAGSKGGTIVNARGSSVNETSKLFSMEIEPEKEIVIILSEVDQTDAIVSSIRESLKIDQPGNGIVYVQDVYKTYGIFK